ncbi:MAG: GNAT family N-acetyltransferase [Gammaproteobacteria bacterium]
MNTVLQWAQERGFDSMELFTAPALQEAVRLYERYGFVRVAGKNAASTNACDLHFRLQLHDGIISG